MVLKERLGVAISILLGFLFGCVVADFFPWMRALPIIILGLFGALVLVWPKSAPRVIVLFILMTLVGVVRWQGAYRAWNANLLYGEELDIVGWFKTPIQQKENYDQAIIHVDSIHLQGAETRLSNSIQLAAEFPRQAPVVYGDKIQFKAKLRRLPKFGSFDGVRYWRVKHVQAIVSVKVYSLQGKSDNRSKIFDAIYRLRAHTTLRVQSILPGPEGALLLGILFGNTGQLSKEINDQFRTLGISHLTAVSGYNLTIISLWPLILAGLVPKRSAIAIATVLVGLFVIFTGAPSSILRAAIMAWVVLYGKFFGRAPHTLLLIVLTAGVMAAINPFVVKDDAGFILSFLAFFGIVELAPLITLRFKKMKGIVAETLGAQLATLPYLLGVFGQFAYIAPLTNAIILPLIPLVMIVGLVLVMLSLIPLAPFLKLVGLLYYPMHALLWFVAKVAHIPYISSEWPKGGYFPWYLVIVVFAWWLIKRRVIMLTSIQKSI